MTSKIVTLIILSIFIASCDPGFNEQILIVNKTNRTLPIRIIQDYESHSYWTFGYDNNIILTVTEKDSVFLTEFNLLPNETFYLWDAGGIGHVSLETRLDGENKFKRICDSFYIEGCKLKKDIGDFNQWRYYYDPDCTGGGETIYTFEIADSILIYNR